MVGDNPTPYACALLGTTTTDALTTGDLSTGDAGEMGILPEFAVEFFVGWTALPGVLNVFMRGPLSSSGANYEWRFEISAAGKISFFVTDDGGTVRSANCTTTLQTFSLGVSPPTGWYHVVGTAQGGNLNIYLNGVLEDANATWGSHTVATMGSTAGSEDMRVIGPTVATAMVIDEVAVYRTGLTATRVAAHYTAATSRGFRAESPASRIIGVLDTVSSHAPRSIQTGTRNVVPRYMSGQAPIDEIRRAVEAEDVDAAFFVNASGVLTFLADGHRSSSPYNTVQATFGDGAGELAYEDVQTDYSGSDLINEWNVTRTPYSISAPMTQTVSDSTSISRYFKRSQSLADVPVTQDSDASAIATALLAKYKDPFYRITSIRFNTIDPNVTEAIFRRELMDKVRILRTPPGGGSRIQQDVFIQKIEVQGANDGGPWTVTWGVSPL